MKITITAMMLCDLLGGKFTLEACEAICDLYEESECAPHIGDIACCFGEIPADDAEDGDKIIRLLDNGNALIEY